jgi:hypothetical protein
VLIVCIHAETKTALFLSVEIRLISVISGKLFVIGIEGDDKEIFVKEKIDRTYQ